MHPARAARRREDDTGPKSVFCRGRGTPHHKRSGLCGSFPRYRGRVCRERRRNRLSRVSPPSCALPAFSRGKPWPKSHHTIRQTRMIPTSITTTMTALAVRKSRTAIDVQEPMVSDVARSARSSDKTAAGQTEGQTRRLRTRSPTSAFKSGGWNGFAMRGSTSPARAALVFASMAPPVRNMKLRSTSGA